MITEEEAADRAALTDIVNYYVRGNKLLSRTDVYSVSETAIIPSDEFILGAHETSTGSLIATNKSLYLLAGRATAVISADVFETTSKGDLVLFENHAEESGRYVFITNGLEFSGGKNGILVYDVDTKLASQINVGSTGTNRITGAKFIVSSYGCLIFFGVHEAGSWRENLIRWSERNNYLNFGDKDPLRGGYEITSSAESVLLIAKLGISSTIIFYRDANYLLSWTGDPEGNFRLELMTEIPSWRPLSRRSVCYAGVGGVYILTNSGVFSVMIDGQSVLFEAVAPQCRSYIKDNYRTDTAKYSFISPGIDFLFIVGFFDISGLQRVLCFSESTEGKSLVMTRFKFPFNVVMLLKSVYTEQVLFEDVTESFEETKVSWDNFGESALGVSYVSESSVYVDGGVPDSEIVERGISFTLSAPRQNAMATKPIKGIRVAGTFVDGLSYVGWEFSSREGVGEVSGKSIVREPIITKALVTAQKNGVYVFDRTFNHKNSRFRVQSYGDFIADGSGGLVPISSDSQLSVGAYVSVEEYILREDEILFRTFFFAERIYGRVFFDEIERISVLEAVF